MQQLFDLYLPGKIYKPKLIIMYIGFGDYRDKDISEGAFEILDMFFDLCRVYKVKGLFRIGYHGVIKYDHRRDEISKIELAKVCATEEIMLRHIDQLAPFIAKNKDCIHKLSSGFIGMGGEMAYAYQYPIVNYNTIITAVIEKLCIPNGLYYTVRSPKYKLDLLENDPDFPYADLIGFNNDAIWGEQENPNWNSGCWQKGHTGTREEEDCEFLEHFPNTWWDYVIETGYRTPQSGEMFHNTHKQGIIPSGDEVIKELAHHRHTTLSQWNNYLETPDYEIEPDENGNKVIGYSVMQDWINYQLTTQQWLRKFNIIYDPAWFYDDEGNEVYRNPYEFIRDHLGYKLQAQSLELDGSHATLTLKNFGFAAAFNLKSGFAVLDENYKVIEEIPAGEPEKWYSHDSENWKSDEVLLHRVESDIPNSAGEQRYLAFYLRNSLGEFARMSNAPESVPFVNGYHILSEI